MPRHLDTRAAITWSSTADTSVERVHLLSVPLRDIEPAHSQVRYASDSLDRSTREVLTIGNGAHEFIGTVRYDDHPQSLVDLIRAGANNTTVTYYPDLADPQTAFACKLIEPSDPRAAVDGQRQGFGEAMVTLRLRRTDQSSFQPLYQGSGVLFHYRAGDDLSGATFTRADTATYAAKGLGTVTTATTGRARVEWVDLDGDGIRESPTLLLEQGRTNLVTDSAALTAWTDIGTPGETSGQADPSGGTGAYLVEDNDAAAGEGHRIAVSFTGDGTKCFSTYIRQGTGNPMLGVFDDTASTFRHLILATWSNGVPVLTTINGSGTRYAVERAAGGWWRIMASAENVVAASANYFYLYPAGNIASNTGTTYWWGMQAENAVYPSSHIPTASGTDTRAADTLYMPFTARPQAMTAYCRFVDQGAWDIANQAVLWVNGASSNAAFLDVNGGGAGYRVTHHNGTVAVSSNLAAAPSFGDVVELVVELRTDGSVRLHQSINGASITSAPATAANALSHQWGGQRIYFNSTGDTSNFSAVKHRDILVVRGIQSFAAMRRLAGV